MKMILTLERDIRMDMTRRIERRRRRRMRRRRMRRRRRRRMSQMQLLIHLGRKP